MNNVVDLPRVGKVGALACWEHIQPLLKYHTYLQREEIHVAAWPPLEPFVPSGSGLWGMSREGCTGQSQQYALESGAFVLQTTGLMTEKAAESMNLGGTPIYTKPGGGCAAVFGPDGRVMTDEQPDAEEKIIYVNLEMDAILTARAFVDSCGHYSRPDMLWLGVDKRQPCHVEERRN